MHRVSPLGASIRRVLAHCPSGAGPAGRHLLRQDAGGALLNEALHQAQLALQCVGTAQARMAGR